MTFSFCPFFDVRSVSPQVFPSSRFLVQICKRGRAENTPEPSGRNFCRHSTLHCRWTPTSFSPSSRDGGSSCHVCSARLSLLSRSLPAVHTVCEPWPFVRCWAASWSFATIHSSALTALVLMQPVVSSQALGSESEVLSRVLVNEHPPLQPSRQVVVVIFVVVARDHHLSNFARRVSSVVCKAFVCEKNFFPVSTIVWIWSSHGSSAAGAVFVFSHFPGLFKQILVQLLQEGTHVLLTLAGERLQCDQNLIVFSAASVPPSLSSEQARPTLGGDDIS